MTPAALARYRLRPVPWGWLAVLVTGWLLGTRLLVELLIDPGMSITVVRWTALLLGLGGAVLAAPETDPPQDLLRAGPVPHWRTLALRLAGWLALGAAPILSPGGAAGRHRRLDRRRAGRRNAARLRPGDRVGLPGRRQDLDP